MALPTSVSSSSWVNLDNSEGETASLPSPRPLVSTLTSDKVLFTPVSTAPSAESVEFLALLSESVETRHLNSTTVLPKNCTSSLSEDDKRIDTSSKSCSAQENEGDNGVLVEAALSLSTATLHHATPGVSSNHSASFRCSTTDAHQQTQVSAILSSVPLSPEEANSLKICSKDIASITSSVIFDTYKKLEVGSSVASDAESLRKASVGKRIIENWSTSTDSNIDCEGGNCEGTEIRCRKCGKIVPKSKVQGHKKTATTEQKSGRTSRSNSLDKIKQSNSKGEQQVEGNSSPNKQRRGSKEKNVLPKARYTHSLPRKHSGIRNYSAVLSACSRPIKKGTRRTSVDVLYAREPSEPSIDKIKAKRRLSRQTDVSSFELMTLTEGNEPEDNSAAQNSYSLVVPAEEQTPLTDVLEYQMDRIRMVNTQFSPTNPSLNDRIQELRAASSIESCPRAPWNSLETTISSSQDTDDKYINYEPRERLPQDYRQETGEAVDMDDRKMENEECEGEDVEIDPGEPSNDDEVNAEPHNGARQKQRTVKKPKKNCVRGSRVKRVQERQKALGDWSTEVVILMALLVYLACKALNFIEFLVPARNKKK